MQQSFPPVDGVTHHFVEVNGVKLHVAQAGSGEPLLMLHGWPQHWYMWRYQIPALAQRYSLICPDLPGFGWSGAPGTGYEKERLVDDLVALLDALELNSVRLIGHDWGGWIGFLLCLRQPTRIQRYLALNIAHPFQKLDRRVFSMWRTWYQAVIASPLLGPWIVGSRSGFVRMILRTAFVNHRLSEQDIAIYTRQFDDPVHVAASVAMYRTFLLREAAPMMRGRYRSSRLSPRTLLLFGRHDPAISPALLKGYEPYADDMKIEFVSDSGHFIAEDQPALVTERAVQFFA